MIVRGGGAASMGSAFVSAPASVASSVLLIEDSAVETRLVIQSLGNSSILDVDLDVVGTLAEALDRLTARRYSALLLDLSLPDAHGLAGLARLRACSVETPIIVLTGDSDPSLGPQAVRCGAHDYIRKLDLGTALMPRALRYAIERCEVERAAREGHKRESLGRLASGVAHEFNNLLSVILGHAAIALMQVGAEGTTRKRLMAITRAAERAARTSRGALAFCKGATLGHHPTDPNSSVSESVLRTCAESGVGVAFLRLTPSLPAIEVDPEQLSLAVEALVRNALEAVEGDATRVSVRTREVAVLGGESHGAWRFPLSGPRPGRYVCIEVEDTGGGLPPEEMRRMFEPCYTTKGVGRGFGLGYVLGIVDAHGGSVGAQSSAEGRTRFRMWIPSSVTGQKAVDRGARQVETRTPRMLVVDQQADVLEAISAAMTERGYEVLIGHGGLEGLGRWRSLKDRIDAVLLACCMQPVSGRDVLAAIRAEDPNLPIVLTSTRGFDPALRTAASTATTFLPKPFTPSALQAKLEALGIPRPDAS